MNRAERRRARKTETITPGVAWHFIIIRRGRDLPRLTAALQAGDPVSQQFFIGLGQWLAQWHAAAVPPLRLAREYEFVSEAAAPDVFGMAYSEDPRVGHLLLTPVCPRCAGAKNDVELLNHGGEMVCKIVKGRPVGFSDTRPPSGPR
jgi:hypothetical protein